MSQQSLTRTMYRAQIKEVLLARILNGAYQPGERIVETRVAREFGVSQGPVREALRELEDMRRIAATGEIHDFVLHDVRFHRLIVEGSGNRTLGELWTSLQVDARTMITFLHYGDLPAVAESHVPILEALRARDPERSSAALREHFEYYARRVAEPAPDEAPPAR